MTTTQIRASGVRYALRPLDDDMHFEWADLWERAGAPVWLHPTWTRLWWNAFGRGRLALTAVRRGGRLVGVAPTALVGDELVATANGHSPAWGIVAEDDAAVDAVARAMVAAGRRINVSPVRTDEPTIPALRRAATAAGHLLLERDIGISPTIDTTRDFGHTGAISARRRRDIRRRWRRLAEEGPLSFDLRGDPNDIEEALDRCLAVEARGWKGEAGSAIAASMQTTRFYRELAEWAASHGWFKIAELCLDGHTMAFDFALEADGIHYLLKTSFDPAFAKFSPGTLLRDAIVTRAFTLGFRRYEFLGKLDGWKREWTHTGHPMTQLRIFPPTVDGTLRRLAYAAAWRLRDRTSED